MSKIEVMPNGFIKVETKLSIEDISYLPSHAYNLMRDLLHEELTEEGKEGAYVVLGVLSNLLPDEFQLLNGMKEKRA